MKQLLIILFFILSLFADPFNETKIEIDLNNSNPYITLQFTSFNIEKPLNIKDANKESINQNRQKAINYISSNIKINPCSLKLNTLDIKNEMSVNVKYNLICPKNIDKLNISFTLFFEFDKTQSGITKLITKDSIQTFVLSPSKSDLTINLKKTVSLFEYFKLFLIEGIWHIWIGIDHILFLLMLILPITLIYNKNFFTSFKEVLKIVTAFTISHSITLSLSMFNVIETNDRIIETLIAFSVLTTAILNIKPIKLKTWILAFGFGFIHGFGFANVLKELELPSQNFLTTLFGFNIGVEIGQIIIVLVLLPIIYIFRNSIIYKYFVIISSIIVAIISILWIVDRWWKLNFMPF
jgi:hypothetical protein